MLNTELEGEVLDYYSFSNFCCKIKLLVAFVNGFYEERLHAGQSCIQIEQPCIQAVIASHVRQRVHSRTHYLHIAMYETWWL
jgi:hypothetical protein